MEKSEVLPGNFISGFIDGEGCFALKFVKDAKIKRRSPRFYFYWKGEFIIVVRKDDQDLLEKIKSTLGCGKIYEIKEKGQIRYSIQNIDDLYDKIVPFFEKYPLHGKKKKDFKLWKEALKIIYKYKRKDINAKKDHQGFTSLKENWKEEDLKRLFEIRDQMRKFKSKFNKKYRWREDKWKIGPYSSLDSFKTIPELREVHRRFHRKEK